MIFLTGGARSGKSTAAIEILQRHGGGVLYIATARPTDAEMEQRIEAHRRVRPEEWRLVEEPFDLLGALCGAAAGEAVLLDCLTLWVSNLMEDHDDREILDASDAASQTASRRASPTIVVSNEVGSGLVPMHPLGRRFRDLAGRVNQMWAQRSEQSFLVVAAKLIPLRSPGDIDV